MGVIANLFKESENARDAAAYRAMQDRAAKKVQYEQGVNDAQNQMMINAYNVNLARAIQNGGVVENPNRYDNMPVQQVRPQVISPADAYLQRLAQQQRETGSINSGVDNLPAGYKGLSYEAARARGLVR